jgi:ribonuclease J
MEEIKQEETVVVAQEVKTTPEVPAIQSSQTKEESKEETKAPKEAKKPQHNHSKKPQHKNGKRQAPRNLKPIPETKGDGWISDLKKAHTANEKIHKDRLNPHYKLDLNTNAKMRITPLGGLGEIGGNMMVIETDKSAIIVDVGMNFPDETMHGVDILIPDFTYLREIKHKIEAIIITHGHEDHIGAMPYLFKEMQFPIYGTSLPLAMIGNKFDEHHIKDCRKHFNPVL